MSAATIAVEVLLAIAVSIALLCCLGILLMKDFYERLHLPGPRRGALADCRGRRRAGLATFAIAISVLIKLGF